MRTRSSAKRAEASALDPMVDEKQELVALEVASVVELQDHTFAHSFYHDLASDSRIRAFLKNSRSYSIAQRRWKLPRNYAKLFDQDFYTPFLNVISSIVKHFWNDTTGLNARQVVDTHARDLRHRETGGHVHFSRPSLAIKAEGPSFQLPGSFAGARLEDIGFSSISSCIEIQVEDRELPVSEQLLRVAVYARQLFIHQPNRRFVRVLVLTGQYLRLFHFDRSGVQYTPLLDIHTNPHTFVRLILGLSSPNENDIGLDTSIQWRIVNGRKVCGILKARGAEDNEVEYPLRNVEPFFRRSDITGRCTTCWRVSDPATGEELVVKDSWRPHDRPSEGVYLEEALGIAGVAQMVSYQSDRGQTVQLRGAPTVTFQSDSFENRVNTRIVMKGYGDSLTTFKSAKELLYALRDAIAGHMQLLKKGIVHRDVSLRNIFKGRPGAAPGDRGILIDLDMAIRYGTTLYQSVMVLHSCDAPGPLAHDHLDDLESFLYVLTHIIHLYDQHGTFHSVVDPLKLWDGHEGVDAAWLKLGYLAVDTIPRHIASRWPAACVRVLREFRAFLGPLVREKMGLLYEDSETPANTAEKLRASAEDHYSHVLRLFDDGIAGLDEAEVGESAPKRASVAPPAPTSPPSTSRNPLKRAFEDYPDAQPAAKRTNSSRVARYRRTPDSTTRSTPRSA